MNKLTDLQRKGVEEAYLRALRQRYPGRLVTIDWDNVENPDNPQQDEAPQKPQAPPEP